MSKVVGIDLGTTFSAIASLDDLGNPEVLASIEDNRKITASAVYLKDNEVIVGDKALNYLKDQSKNVILQTKREMENDVVYSCLLYTSPSPRDVLRSRMPSSA